MMNFFLNVLFSNANLIKVFIFIEFKNVMKYLLIIFLLSFPVYSQTFSVGANIGGGIIGSNSPNQTSAFGAIYIDSYHFDNLFTSRLKFIYGSDINSLLPESQSVRYYPFIKAFSYETVFIQQFAPRFFIEESLGILFINDRTFPDINEWGYGVNGGLAAGFMLNETPFGWRIGIGLEFGFATHSSNVRYFSIYFGGKYIM